MFLFYGLEQFLIDIEVSKITNNIDNINIVKYDLEDININKIIEDASTLSLFEEKKIIIVNNAYIFTGSTSKKQVEQNTKILEDYMNSSNPNTILIFTINKDKLDSRKKIVSLFKTVGVVKELNKIANINSFVSDLFKPYKIDLNSINLLIDRVGTNLYILEKEIIKLKTYKDSDLIITKEDILLLTNKNVDMDIFKLIDNILSGNKEASIECYHEMLKFGEEPIAIIIMLANQLRIMYQVKQLAKKGYTERDIAEKLEIHEYRVKKGLEKARSFREEDILNNLEKLADIDIELKKGNIDKNVGLELFILNYK